MQFPYFRILGCTAADRIYMSGKEDQNGRDRSFEKYIGIGMTAFGVIAASMVLFFCLFRLNLIFRFLSRLTVILKPFIYGIAIAYLLNPIFVRIQSFLRGVLLKPLKSKKADSFSKILSSILSIALLIIGIFALLALIIPELYTSVMNFAGQLSTYLNQAEGWLRKILNQYPDIESTVLSYYDSISDTVTSWVSDTLMPGASTMFNAATKGIGSMLSFFYNFFIGMIVAIYLLNAKEVMLPQCKKLIYGVLRNDYADAVLNEAQFANQMFSGFVYGKIIDSLIIGIIMFIVGNILRLPYNAMISVIVGVTNVIPFFGPYIGAIPSAVILLLTNPFACIKFVIAIVIIQQFDGNILGPKILGNTTGLSSFWVLFSILLFGGLFGFVGMIIGVPLFAIIYHIIKSRVEFLLAKKGMPVESSAYAAVKEEKKERKGLFRGREKGEKQDEQD